MDKGVSYSLTLNMNTPLHSILLGQMSFSPKELCFPLDPKKGVYFREGLLILTYTKPFIYRFFETHSSLGDFTRYMSYKQLAWQKNLRWASGLN